MDASVIPRWAVAAFLVFTAFGLEPTSVRAVVDCRATVSRTTGAIEVTATLSGGTPLWGSDPNAVHAAFSNVGTCVSGTKAKKCNIGDPTDNAGSALPSGCTIYVIDAGPACAAYIKGCLVAGADAGADGVVQINQARAVQGGVTSGDGPGFPVSITAPGSYRLAGNLIVPDENTTAIEIATANVTVDLNGFAICGTTACSGGPPVTSCSPLGDGQGVRTVAGRENVTVRNGTVRGMGGTGVTLGAHARVERVRAISNGQHGIEVGANSEVTKCLAAKNNGDGVSALGGGLVFQENVVVGNQGDGLSASDGQGATVRTNLASRNHGYGIACDVVDCTVTGNVATWNGLQGLHANPDALNSTGYSQNVFNDNNGGNGNLQVFGGLQMGLGSNVCRDSLTCP